MSAPQTRRRHPHFDDRGTLDWHTTFAEASAQAQREGKKLFVDIGRELCGTCRTFVSAVVPRPDVAPLLQQHYVVLAGDPDLPEAEVHRLMFKLKNAAMLPFLIVADARGQFVDGLSGVADPARIKTLLETHAGAPPRG